MSRMSASDLPKEKSAPKAREILADIIEVLDDVSNPSSSATSAESLDEQAYLQNFRDQSINSQMAYAHLKGIRDHYSHKGKWSWFLMFAVGGMIIFQYVLLIFVGLGRFDFSEYEWLLPALLVQNLGQVIGLAVYAVKHLFSDISQKKVK